MSFKMPVQNKISRGSGSQNRFPPSHVVPLIIDVKNFVINKVNSREVVVAQLVERAQGRFFDGHFFDGHFFDGQFFDGTLFQRDILLTGHIFNLPRFNSLLSKMAF